MSINRTTPRDEVTKAYYDGWDDARAFYEGHTIARVEAIEECVLWLEVLHPYMPIETVMERLRTLKDQP